MARAYFSTVLDHPADRVWSVIRPFDHYSWAGVPGETVIEDGRKGDQVGSTRRFSNGGRSIRQILLAHSDLDRSYSYAFCNQPPFPVQHYLATIRVTPVVDTSQAFVEWWATFDCAPEDHDSMIEQFERGGFAVWLRALRQFMAGDRTSRAAAP
jgi:polyketide cyclase/dehydrase/lipid transport protein